MKKFLRKVKGKSVYIWGAGTRYGRVAKWAEVGGFDILGAIDINTDNIGETVFAHCDYLI